MSRKTRPPSPELHQPLPPVSSMGLRPACPSIQSQLNYLRAALTTPLSC